jgi:protein-S-isoprenylcysteine O-methyltransferase Ste14
MMMSGRLLVAAQFLLITLLIWPWSAPVFVVPAIAMALPAVAFGLWILKHNRPGNFNIRPDVKPGAQLVVDGPYALVRHPMYVAVLWLGLCAVLLYASAATLLLWLLLGWVLDRKAALEERYLHAHFPEYAAYTDKVGRFLPKRAPG